jgi:hypothetical protein
MHLLKYPDKIIIALAESIHGNEKISRWLLENGFPELAAFASAIKGSDEASQWLLKNHFPELAALDAAISNSNKAYQWLQKNDLTFYILIADACQGKPAALFHLKKDPKMEPFLYLSSKTKEFFDSKTYDYHRKPSGFF